MCKRVNLPQFFLLLLIFGTVLACVGFPTSKSSTVQSPIPSQDLQNTSSTLKPTSTDEFVDNNRVRTPDTETAPDLLGKDFVEQCPQQINNLSFTKYEGVIVYPPFQDPHMYNLQTGISVAFPPGNIAKDWVGWQFIGSSQDRNWFYYKGPQTLPAARSPAWVVGGDGKVVARFNTPSLVINTNWVNSETVLFVTPGPEVTLLNPFTMEWEDLQLGITNLYNLDPPASWSFEVDPTLKKVIYPPSSSSGHFRYALFDIGKNEVIWEKNDDFAPFAKPKWSPQGHHFIIIDHTKADHNELFLVDENGEETQLTNYEAQFPISIIDNFNWSPDGTKIAFWLDLRSQFEEVSSKKFLTVFDLEIRKSTFFCVTTLYDHGEAPVWSPNSHALILRVRDKDGQGKNLFIDLVENVFADLPVDTFWPPIDWLKAK